MAGKHKAEDLATLPPAKRVLLNNTEPLAIAASHLSFDLKPSSAASTEDLDVKRLQHCNRQLAILIQNRKEELERMETQLHTINEEKESLNRVVLQFSRVWDQLDSDIAILSRRLQIDSSTPETDFEQPRQFIREALTVNEEDLESLRPRVHKTAIFTGKLLNAVEKASAASRESLSSAISLHKQHQQQEDQSDLAQELDKVVSQLQEVEAQHVHLHTEFRKLSSKNRRLEEKTQEMASKLARVDEEVHLKRPELDKLKLQNTRLKEKVCRAEAEITSLIKASTVAQAAVIATPTESKSDGAFSAEIQEQTEIAEARLKEYEAYQQQLNDLKSERDKAQHEFSLLLDEAKDFHSGFDFMQNNLKTEIASLREQLAKRNNDIVGLEIKHKSDLQQFDIIEDSKWIQIERDLTKLAEDTRKVQQERDHYELESKKKQQQLDQSKRVTSEEQQKFIQTLEIQLQSQKSESQRLSERIEEKKLIEPINHNVELRLIQKELRTSKAVVAGLRAQAVELTTTQSNEQIDHADAIQKLKTELEETKSQEAYTQMMASIEEIATLKATLESKQSDEQALLQEMEITGDAFTDLQAQNGRLLMQLREQEAVLVSLRTEKAKQDYRQLLVENERKLLADKAVAAQTELTKKNAYINQSKEMEKKNRTELEQQSIVLAERTSVIEEIKHKLADVDNAMKVKEVQLEKALKEIADLKQSNLEKTMAIVQDNAKLKRLEESLALSSKPKRTTSTASDEVVEAEIKSLRKQITCPTCNTDKMDTVILKCFHVFCEKCVQGRIDRRERKCPGCNQPFGINDHHKIFW